MGSGQARGHAVVAGVDGSAGSAEVAAFAAAEAAARAACLHLVHVVPWPNPGAAFTRYADRVWVDELRRSAEELLAGTAAALSGTLPQDRVRCTVGWGDPVAELVRCAAGADVLVVGPRGTGGVAGLVIGSTATGVAAHADCPVVVLPGRPTATPADRRSVVVGVADAAGDAAVLSFAVTEAALRRTDVVAVHAWLDSVTDPGFGTTSALVDVTGLEAEERRVLAEALAGFREQEPDVVLREVVVRRGAAAALVAASRGAQLLVVGRPHGNPLRRLGSASHAVLNRAGCPVAVVPTAAVGAPR